MIWHSFDSFPNGDRPYMLWMRRYNNAKRKFEYTKEFVNRKYVREDEWEILMWMDIPDPDVARE